MKKLIQASCILFLIGAFVFFTQVSCQKSMAQTNAASTGSPNLILYGKNVPITKSSTDSAGNPTTITIGWSYQFYVCGIDGSNSRQIPITAPSGFPVIGDGHLTEDGKMLVFTVNSLSLTGGAVYSCLLDGSNLKKVMDLDTQTNLLDAY